MLSVPSHPDPLPSVWCINGIAAAFQGLSNLAVSFQVPALWKPIPVQVQLGDHKQKNCLYYFPVFPVLLLTCWMFRDPAEICGSCMSSAPCTGQEVLLALPLQSTHLWVIVGGTLPTFMAFGNENLCRSIGSTKQENFFHYFQYENICM